MTEIAPITQPTLRPDLLDRMSECLTHTVSDATIRAYAFDMAHYEAWCASQGLTAIPAHPMQIGGYLVEHSGPDGFAVATLERRLAAIGAAHRQAGFQLDTRSVAISGTMRAIRRQYGVKQKQAKAATGDIILSMVGTCDGSLIGLRDRAMLLVGFAGGMREEQIAELEVEHLEFRPEGVLIFIPSSKTDQEHRGTTIAIKPASVIQALQAWLAASGITTGHVFRSVNRHGSIALGRVRLATVSDIIKKRASLAGLDGVSFSGHSLRRGFVTTAARANRPDAEIARTTGHHDLRVLRSYREEASIWVENATDALGI